MARHQIPYLTVLITLAANQAAAEKSCTNHDLDLIWKSLPAVNNAYLSDCANHDATIEEPNYMLPDEKACMAELGYSNGKILYDLKDELKIDNKQMCAAKVCDYPRSILNTTVKAYLNANCEYEGHIKGTIKWNTMWNTFNCEGTPETPIADDTPVTPIADMVAASSAYVNPMITTLSLITFAITMW